LSLFLSELSLRLDAEVRGEVTPSCLINIFHRKTNTGTAACHAHYFDLDWLASAEEVCGRVAPGPDLNIGDVYQA
jgi:hypothetical protein